MIRSSKSIACQERTPKACADAGRPRRRFVRALTRLLVGGVGLVALISEGRAQSADFSGKTLTIISSFAPGGGYDIYARLFAKHVAKHLPGRPAVVVKNMPGAGGLVGTNYLFNV